MRPKLTKKQIDRKEHCSFLPNRDFLTVYHFEFLLLISVANI